MDITFIIVLIICGFLTSILSAVFGVGGAIIVVPVLTVLFPETPAQSIAATSLMIVTLGALVNVLLFRHQHIGCEIKKLIFWCLAMLGGVQTGVWLSFLLSDQLIMSIFAITLIILAFKIFLADYFPHPESNQSDTIVGSLLCSIGGMVAGVTGLGGGSVLAPLISQLPSVNHRQLAVYTNWMMLIGGLGSIWGYLTTQLPDVAQSMADWQVGYINFYVVAIVFLSSLVMSRFSLHLRGVLSERVATRIFAVLLIIIAVFIVVRL